MSNLGNFVQCRFVTPLAIGAAEMTLYAADAPYNLPPAGGGLLVLCDSPGNPSFIEVISYASRTGLNLSGVVRGLEGTTARAWSGFAYCFQSMLAGDYAADLASKEPTIATAALTHFWRGDKTWQDFAGAVRGSALTGLNLTVATAVAAADSVLVGIGKLQKQITDAATNLAANVRATVLTGFVNTANTPIVAADSVLVALGKAQAQINDKAAASHTHSYAPLTGAGTSGSWPISITGSAAACSGNSASASAVAWSGVSGKPTTLAGYGITNGYAMDGVNTGWFRSSAGTGWYNETYNGGIYMEDATYVRTYGGKSFLCNDAIQIDGVTPQVRLNDTNWGVRYLYHDAGLIGFLSAAGGWTFHSDNSGNTTAMGNVTAYSDIRLKKDIELIPDALDKVCALRGVTYERIDSGERQTGVIAQEVQAVLPEAVMTMADEQQTLSVAYGNLVGLLIEAIKELKAEVDVLKQGAK